MQKNRIPPAPAGIRCETHGPADRQLAEWWTAMRSPSLGLPEFGHVIALRHTLYVCRTCRYPLGEEERTAEIPDEEDLRRTLERVPAQMLRLIRKEHPMKKNPWWRELESLHDAEEVYYRFRKLKALRNKATSTHTNETLAAYIYARTPGMADSRLTFHEEMMLAFVAALFGSTTAPKGPEAEFMAAAWEVELKKNGDYFIPKASKMCGLLLEWLEIPLEVADEVYPQTEGEERKEGGTAGPQPPPPLTPLKQHKCLCRHLAVDHTRKVSARCPNACIKCGCLEYTGKGGPLKAAPVTPTKPAPPPGPPPSASEPVPPPKRSHHRARRLVGMTETENKKAPPVPPPAALPATATYVAPPVEEKAQETDTEILTLFSGADPVHLPRVRKIKTSEGTNIKIVNTYGKRLAVSLHRDAKTGELFIMIGRA